MNKKGLEADKKANKIVELNRAIQEIQNGMAVYVHNAGAAVYELFRQFHDRHPNFTLMMSLLGGPPVLGLIHGGLIQKIIFTTCSDLGPRPTPNPIIQRAFKQKKIDFENWSVLSFTQALIAGALNLPFMPTLSIMGSSIAEENHQSFTVITDPFEKREIGLIKSLNPDIALVHGWAADSSGNTILAPAVDNGNWGAKASKRGVIVTVERIVSPDFIKEHSTFVKIPGYMVNAVCVVPLGAHPYGMNAQSFSEFKGYIADNKFIQEFRLASENEERLNKWLGEWVLNCKTHNEYKEKLGLQRIYELDSRSTKNIRQFHPTPTHINKKEKQTCSEVEFEVIGAARKIKDIIIKRGLKTMFAGMGLASLAGCCAYYSLKEDGYEIDMVGSGIGFVSDTGNPLMINLGNTQATKMLPEVLDVHGVCVGGAKSECLGILGAAQIDKYGNINSTKIGDDLYITGAGGGNDIASGAQAVVVITTQKGDRLTDKISYITCPGTKVMTLISNEGVYEKKGLELILTEFFPKGNLSQNKRIQQILNTCGWELKISSEIKEVKPPSIRELKLLRSLDPEGIYLHR